MRSLVEPIAKLQQHLGHFLATPRLRMLAVSIDEALRVPVTDMASKVELLVEERLLALRLEEPFASDRRGWQERATSVVAQYDANRAAWSAGGLVAPGLSELFGASASSDEPAALADRLLQIAAIICAPHLSFAGIVCVVAPVRATAVRELAADLVDLAAVPQLDRVRWIVVGVGDELAEELARSAGSRVAAAAVECKIDEAVRRAGMMARLAVGAGGGRVGPNGVTPPSRPGQRPPARSVNVPEEIKEALNESEGAAHLAQVVQAAALAASEGTMAEAVRLQRQALEMASALGSAAETVTMGLLLATYEMQLPNETGGGIPVAIATMQKAFLMARAAELNSEAAKAALGLGHLYHLSRDVLKSLGWYVRAGRLAAKANAVLLAIEAFRVGGQLAKDAGFVKTAIKTWGEALDAASKAPIEEVRESSVVDVARLLAATYRAHNLDERAAECDSFAEHVEHGTLVETVPTAAPGPMQRISVAPSGSRNTAAVLVTSAYVEQPTASRGPRPRQAS